MAITYMNSHQLRLPTQYSHEIKKTKDFSMDAESIGHVSPLAEELKITDGCRKGQSLFYASVGDSPHTLLWEALIELDGLFSEKILSWVEMGDRSGTSLGRWSEGVGDARGQSILCIHA